MAHRVYCLPGHVGLSIVDAFYCGLPLITEDVDHAPEICYLKEGENGFLVGKGNVDELADKLNILLSNDKLLDKMSLEAKRVIESEANINRMCEGFVKCFNSL